MKIATWNVNSLKVRLPQVLSWLQNNDVDVLVLQELKLASEFFPIEEFENIGYEAVWNGQKTYNGVAIISRLDMHNSLLDNPFYEDEQKRIITTTINDIRIINVYCVNGEKIGSPKFDYKKEWFQALSQLVENELKTTHNLILLGDFNIAPTDLDVYDPKAWHEKVLCSSEERSWFKNLLDLGLYDSLRTLDSESALYTWWDYRLNGFKRNLGMRIDHILITKELLENTIDFGIDVNMRGLERPSDHAPVWLKIKS
ncbi:MAG: exodeoxyribonuclease III [Neisseriaceae bacterium]|nr:exodeoxyribonuclease III [Neisseriaceae bacterium PsAf]MCV2504003.1 exodeoxyribonuclease III [Neisseriaceae bacterium]MCV2508963.1 exodeoxyribonuclease III [Neisseriaceae bacterium]